MRLPSPRRPPRATSCARSATRTRPRTRSSRRSARRDRRARLALALALAVAGRLRRDPPADRAHHAPRARRGRPSGSAWSHLGDRGFEVGSGVPAIPLDVMVRHGATDRVDWGLRLLFGTRPARRREVEPARPRPRRTALSISGGRRRSADRARRRHPRPADGERQPRRAPLVHPLRGRRLRHLLDLRLRRPEPGVTYAPRTLHRRRPADAARGDRAVAGERSRAAARVQRRHPGRQRSRRLLRSSPPTTSSRSRSTPAPGRANVRALIVSACCRT